MPDCSDPTTALLRTIAVKDAKIESDAKVIAALRKTLAECAADLEALLLAQYTPADCAVYPDIRRRCDRDMAIVIKARKLAADEQTAGEHK